MFTRELLLNSNIDRLGTALVYWEDHYTYLFIKLNERAGENSFNKQGVSDADIKKDFLNAANTVRRKGSGEYIKWQVRLSLHIALLLPEAIKSVSGLDCHLTTLQLIKYLTYLHSDVGDDDDDKRDPREKRKGVGEDKSNTEKRMEGEEDEGGEQDIP